MRTTLDIDDDLLLAAKEISRAEGRSAGAVVSDLLRAALTGRTAAAAEQRAAPAISVRGFRPFAADGRVVSNALIDQLREQEGV